MMELIHIEENHASIAEKAIVIWGIKALVICKQDRI